MIHLIGVTDKSGTDYIINPEKIVSMKKYAYDNNYYIVNIDGSDMILSIDYLVAMKKIGLLEITIVELTEKEKEEENAEVLPN